MSNFAWCSVCCFSYSSNESVCGLAFSFSEQGYVTLCLIFLTLSMGEDSCSLFFCWVWLLNSQLAVILAREWGCVILTLLSCLPLQWVRLCDALSAVLLTLSVSEVAWYLVCFVHNLFHEWGEWCLAWSYNESGVVWHSPFLLFLLDKWGCVMLCCLLSLRARWLTLSMSEVV